MLFFTPDEPDIDVARITYFYIVIDNKWAIDLKNIRSPKLNFFLVALALGNWA